MRLLLISYYFPPCGGAAVQRWLRWLPDLEENGIQVTVLTTLNGDYPVIDETLLAEIPPEVKVIRVPAPHSGKLWKLLFGGKSKVPYGNLSYSGRKSLLQRLMIWIRLNLIIPDMRMFWNPAAYKAAEQYLRENPTDVMVTTGPPHSTHLIGLKLKQRFRLPWLADWRDPWTSVYYLKLNPPSKLSLYLHRRMEGRVALAADLNITVSQHLAEQLPGDRKSVIYNGFDAWKFANADAETLPSTSARFRLKYIGNITEGQDLAKLLESIATGLKGLDYELTFVGTKLSAEQMQIIQRLFPDRYRVTGFVPHQEALQEMADSEVLLLLINYYEGSEGMLTTKLFEYIASRIKILCIGPHGGEAEKIITENEAGACFDSSELTAAAEYLSSLHSAWTRHEVIKNNRDISALSSQNQAVKLISKLYSLKKS